MLPPTSHDEPAVDQRWRWVATICSVAFLALAWRFREHRVDDAFISFRYGHHLVDGLGLVFNPGERVEGYSNFLWVILLSAGMQIGIAPEILSALLGVAAALATIWVVARAAARLGISPAIQWLAPALLAVNPAFVVWSTGGLESTLQAFLVTLGVTQLMFDRGAGRPGVASAWILLLAALNRSEGLLTGVATGSVLFVLSLRGLVARRTVLVWTGSFGVGFLLYFLWRWNYFGSLLPNTFYAKVDTGGSQVGRGFRYLYAFGSDLGLWLAFPLAGLAIVRRSSLGFPGAVVLLHLAFVVFVGGDGLPMHRFLVPVLGLLFLLVAWGGDAVMKGLDFSAQKQGFVAGALGLACVYSARPNFAGERYEYVQQDIVEVRAWSEIGRWFHDHGEPGSTIGVLPAGAIPWYSGLRALDLLGLNDPVIAHTDIAMGRGEAGHEKYNVGYVLERAPKYLVLGVYGILPTPDDPRRQVEPHYRVERELLRSQEFLSRYRIRQGRTPSGYFAYFERM